MSIYQFANNASTTLGSSITPTATSVTVASGTGSQFPTLAAGQYFTATIFSSATGVPNEIVRVTARTGDGMTIVRGQEGTTAQAWSVGDTFANFVTAGFLNQVADAGALQSQSGNYAVDSGTANAGVVTLVPVPTSLASLIGVPIRVKKGGATSTGAYTLNVNSFGATAVWIGGQALLGGELIANEIYEVVYDGSRFDLISNPGTLQGARLVGNTVTNAKLAQVVAKTLKGNITGSTATPYDVPLADIAEALGLTDNGNVITFPGGTILQTGFVSATLSEGSYTTPFPTPFPTACSMAVVSGIQDTFNANNDSWALWRRQATTRSTLAYIVQRGHDDHNPQLSGISYIAFGN